MHCLLALFAIKNGCKTFESIRVRMILFRYRLYVISKSKLDIEEAYSGILNTLIRFWRKTFDIEKRQLLERLLAQQRQ